MGQLRSGMIQQRSATFYNEPVGFVRAVAKSATICKLAQGPAGVLASDLQAVCKRSKLARSGSRPMLVVL